MAVKAKSFLNDFVADSEFARNVLARIDEDGYIVLPGILAVEEADREYKRMWQWVETVAPDIRRDRPVTWQRRQGADTWPCAQRDMMQLHQAGWVFNDLREIMAERVFEQLYGTRELHCSKDGFTLQRPTQQHVVKPPNDHFDQGQDLGLTCIQGSVALTDQEHDDGCFLCWPGSHRFHGEIMDWRRQAGGKGGRQDFVILYEDEKQFLQAQGIEPRRVPVSRGDVILWRSDLVHKGALPIGRRDNFRSVVYICMLPAVMTPESAYPQKRKAYEQLQTGSHWPCREEWFLPKRGSQQSIQPFFWEPPQLTPRQQLLYGLARYPAALPDAPLAEATFCGERTAGAGDHNTGSRPSRTRRWARGTQALPLQDESAEASAFPTVTSNRACVEQAVDECGLQDESFQENVLSPAALDESGQKEVRKLCKALREIENLEHRQANGEMLLQNQLQKIDKKLNYEERLKSLGSCG
jgi:ectoine hydroxylase-related dioxygenase (phytanoyl-CoA dioxygenase family)